MHCLFGTYADDVLALHASIEGLTKEQRAEADVQHRMELKRCAALNAAYIERVQH